MTAAVLSRKPKEPAASSFERGPLMLFRQPVLDRIAAGEIRLAFRRWKRPTVKAGGTLLTPVGLLAIESVEPIELARLTLRDARGAGFESLEALRDDLSVQRDATLYRIRFTLVGPDPRIALRESSVLSATVAEELAEKLRRLDARAAQPWTSQVLELIVRHPEQSAGDLAALSGFEKEWLKTNVRKLKNLGLTESLNPGYRLSPRGRAFLEQLKTRR